MNPSFLSWVLICISLILLASGWNNFFLQGISHRLILPFIVGWLLCSAVTFTFHLGSINLVGPWLLLFHLHFLYTHRRLTQWLQLGLYSWVLGGLCFVMLEMLRLNPLPAIIHPYVTPTMYIAFVLSLTVFFLKRAPLVQITMLSLGLLIGTTLYQYNHHGGKPPHLADSSFQDLWWGAVITARVMTVFVETVANGCKSLVLLWMRKKSGVD
jgi:hypothetical protein